MLHHIMQMASESGTRQFESLEKVAFNVANMNTTGYKVRRFETFLMPDGRISGVQRTDYSRGSLMVTKRELDVAIDGPGFIPVTQADGTVAYTRDGSLLKNQDGMLVTPYGDIVGEGITLPVNYQKVFIGQTGEVQVLEKGNIHPRTIGKINIVHFPNAEGLKQVGYNKLLETDTSGQPVPSESKILQGSLERSNVHMFYQVDQILRLNAGVISNLRLVKFSDDLYRQSVNLKQ